MARGRATGGVKECLIARPADAVTIEKRPKPKMALRLRQNRSRYDWLWKLVGEVAANAGAWFAVPGSAQMEPEQREKAIRIIEGHCKKMVKAGRHPYSAVAAGVSEGTFEVIVFSAADPIEASGHSLSRPMVTGARRAG